jgi:hypothetical protein
MGQNEVDLRVANGELCQLECVGCFLSRIVSPAVLPDVMQYRHSAVRSHFADRIQQRVVRPAAGRELDADHASIEAALELRLSVRTKIRIDDAIAADAIRMSALKAQEEAVAVFDVDGRRKIDGRGESPASQYRGDVDRDADSLARPQAAGISLLPVAPGRTVV